MGARKGRGPAVPQADWVSKRWQLTPERHGPSLRGAAPFEGRGGPLSFSPAAVFQQTNKGIMNLVVGQVWLLGRCDCRQKGALV